jgi:hypothetical protein
MATYYSIETTGVLDGSLPATRNAPQNYRSKLKRVRSTIVMNGQLIGDLIVLGDLPVGAVWDHGKINSTATLGASTIAVGPVATPAKYKAAAVFTTPDTPTLFGKCAASAGAPLTAVERVVATIAGANLPVGGTLEIDLYYSDTV